jgi:hypothetical protein
MTGTQCYDEYNITARKIKNNEKKEENKNDEREKTTTPTVFVVVLHLTFIFFTRMVVEWFPLQAQYS